MTQIRRRKTLQLSAASALAAGTGGLAGILASGRAPAYAQTQTMHWLRWADFVPASDVLLKGEIVKLCEKDLGMKLTVETINANDIQARITAAIQSGAGPDIFMTVNNWPQLYAESCVDVSDVVDDLSKAQGGYYDICQVIGTVGGKWIGVPWCTGGGLVAYRKSWLAEAGAQEFPKTWDEYRAVGKKLKAAGRPVRPDRRPHLRRRAGLVVPLHVVVGRQGGRGRRQDRRAQHQGDRRVGEVRRRTVERNDGRGRARLG